MRACGHCGRPGHYISTCKNEPPAGVTSRPPARGSRGHGLRATAEERDTRPRPRVPGEGRVVAVRLESGEIALRRIPFASRLCSECESPDHNAPRCPKRGLQ